jgi:3-methyladenine DNA glycosylase AlkC
MGTMNELLDLTAVRALTGRLAAVSPGTRWEALGAISTPELEPLSLRARSDLVSAALIADLPSGYARSAAVIRAALDDPGFRGWAMWPVTETVTTLALASGDDAHFDDALALLALLTPRLTSEFAIRRLLAHDLDRALAIVGDFTAHPDEHVRRLASEGTRSYLPWAIRVPALIARPATTVPILDALYRDDSDYVRRSVANHLNDLSRDGADLVVATAARWTGAPSATTPALVRHALRTLVKRGDAAALALLGFESGALTVSPIELDAALVVAPGSLGFGFAVTNDADTAARVAVDYVVDYRKANGSLSAKVFKLAVRSLRPGETARFARRHAFRELTTRVHHGGVHAIEVQVNGRRSGRTEFTLELEP